MKITRWLVLLLFCTNFSAAFAVPYKPEMPESTTYLSFSSVKTNYGDSTLVLIPFEYKQSALFHAYTYEVIDSVAALLLNNDKITLSIYGYAQAGEGIDTILHFLSLNRALFVRDYILGRGVDSNRILALKAFGKQQALYSGTNKERITLNCRVELRLNYPKPPKKIEIADRDGDGIGDAVDNCPDIYGYLEFNGCRNKDAVVVPFETQQASLLSSTYKVLDSVIIVLKANPVYTISIEGHAYKEEGTREVCNQLAKNRAETVKNYLLSRYIAGSRIESIKSYGYQRPLNAGRDPMEIAGNSRAEIILNHH